jgi:hypothetical protein
MTAMNTDRHRWEMTHAKGAADAKVVGMSRPYSGAKVLAGGDFAVGHQAGRAIRPAPSGTTARSPQLRDRQARHQAGGENEAKTKPFCEATRAFGGGFGSPKPLCLPRIARFLAFSRGGARVWENYRTKPFGE